jgi:sulfoxide reductase heme-binding subunit YedZ
MVAGRRPRRDRALRRPRRPGRYVDVGRGQDHRRGRDHVGLDRVDFHQRVDVVECVEHRLDDHGHHGDHHADSVCFHRHRDGDLGRIVMGALISNETLWYTARGTGFVAVIMLTISVTLGILTSMHWSAPRWPRFVTATLHKNISLLAVIFLATHVLSTIFDSVSPVRLLNAIVPFTGTYRPLGIGLGVVAVDLLVALIVTSLLRKHMSYRTWRAVHWGAYACWPFAMLHGLDSGTDAATPWARVVYVTCAAAFVGALAWRVSATIASPSRPSPRTPVTARR